MGYANTSVLTFPQFLDHLCNEIFFRPGSILNVHYISRVGGEDKEWLEDTGSMSPAICALYRVMSALTSLVELVYSWRDTL